MSVVDDRERAQALAAEIAHLLTASEALRLRLLLEAVPMDLEAIILLARDALFRQAN